MPSRRSASVERGSSATTKGPSLATSQSLATSRSTDDVLGQIGDRLAVELERGRSVPAPARAAAPAVRPAAAAATAGVRLP